jgi:hypothetical protein
VPGSPGDHVWRHHYTQKVGVPGHPGINGNYAYGQLQTNTTADVNSIGCQLEIPHRTFISSNIYLHCVVIYTTVIYAMKLRYGQIRQFFFFLPVMVIRNSSYYLSGYALVSLAFCNLSYIKLIVRTP